MARPNSEPDSAPWRLRLAEDGELVVEIKVIPRAPVSYVVETMADGVLKVKVNAVPEQGRANAEVCSVLARWLGVAKRNVEVVHGHTSQQKRVRVVG